MNKGWIYELVIRFKTGILCVIIFNFSGFRFNRRDLQNKSTEMYVLKHDYWVIW